MKGVHDAMRPTQYLAERLTHCEARTAISFKFCYVAVVDMEAFHYDNSGLCRCSISSLTIIQT